MEENKTISISLPMMQACLTEKAVVLTRIGEAEGFGSTYYEYTGTLVFSCCNVSVKLEDSDQELQSKYDEALKQLVNRISAAELRAKRVLDVLESRNKFYDYGDEFVSETA